MPEQFLHGIEVVEINEGIREIRTVKTSVIGLVGSAPKGPVNTPVLIAGSRREAVAQFGQGVGTIPDALEAIFDQAGAMVVVINVLDPAVHKIAVAAADYVFDATLDTLTLPDAYNLNVIVKDQAQIVTYVAGTDYSINTDTGIITRLTTGAIAAGATVNVGYDKPDETAVSLADMIGGVDAGTGAYTGVHGLEGSHSALALTPRLLIAPGWTHQQALVTELEGIANKMKSIIVAEGPNTTDAAAITYRNLFGSSRVYLVDPHAKVYDAVAKAYISQPVSARVAGMISESDNSRGFWFTPSNRIMNGISGTDRPIDWTFGDPNTRANYLNANDVATIISQQGYRLWGNRTCSSDPRWAFLSVRRTADMINESLMLVHLWAIDRNITRTYLEDVVEGVNAYLRHLTEVGAILGGKCYADPDLNTPTEIAAGRVYFDFDFTPPYPAEHITFRSHLVGDYLTEVISS